VDVQRKEIRYYCSVGNSGKSLLSKITNWLVEAQLCCNDKMEPQKWKIVDTPDNPLDIDNFQHLVAVEFI
jgi:hypothetical protein